MAKITIVPTSHIARESIQLIRDVVEREGPDCIAVELDMSRYTAMKEGEGSLLDSLRALGPLTFLFYFVLKNLQQSLGRLVGVSPGSEMLEAVNLGQQKGVRVAFIDRDIGETFTEVKAVTAKEKIRLLTFVFRSLLPGTSIRLEGGEAAFSQGIDLSKIPAERVVEAAMDVLRSEFSWLYRILVEERNVYMAQRILELSQRFQNIVVVVGAGHAKGISQLLEKQKPDVQDPVTYTFTAG
jgi:pheromone shutdown-related protein TraB